MLALIRNLSPVRDRVLVTSHLPLQPMNRDTLRPWLQMQHEANRHYPKPKLIGL